MIAFDFYTNTYKGVSIPEGEWSTFEAMAAAQLGKYKRIYTVTAPGENAEAMAVCAMADALAYFSAAQNGTGGVMTAVSIGSVSVSYGSSEAVDLSARGREQELYRCATQFLDIYRGVG